MIGCLLIHGFTGGPYEVDPLAEYIKSSTDWKVVVTTLPGHGESLQLKGIKYEQWIEHTEEKIRSLLQECDDVYVIGFSMGGLIASYLAVKYPVRKLVLLSAAAKYINVKQLAKDIGGLVRDSFEGSMKENELYQRYKNKVKNTPISATQEFRKVVNLVRPMLKEVNIPTFIAQGEIDGIVPPKSAQYIYKNISSREKALYFSPHAKHLICHSEDNESLFEEIFHFLMKE